MAQNDSHDQGQPQEFTGCINVKLMLRVLAASEAEAMEMLARLDLERALDEAPYFDPIQDDQGRYFYLDPEPLPPPLDETDEQLRADVADALQEYSQGCDHEN